MTVEPLFLTSRDFLGMYIVHVIIKIIIIFSTCSGMTPVIKYLNKKGFKFGLVSLKYTDILSITYMFY